MLAAAAVFVAPIAIWLRYAEHINTSGGLYSFVEAAAGRRVALAQAAIWIFSYFLYLSYTTVQIVYELLPQVVPGRARLPDGGWRRGSRSRWSAVMIAGRGVTLLVLGLVRCRSGRARGRAGRVTLAHLPLSASSFGVNGPARSLAKASAQTSLLYICGSLPLFLGGELATPVRTIRRGLIAAFVVTALVIVLAVAPLASAPGLLSTDIPGVSVVQQFASANLARVIGIGIAVSTAGVILCEYLALTRLLTAITAIPVRTLAVVIGVMIVAVAPFTLIDPLGFYNSLAQPSLVALWLSQLIVFAVYPRFAAKLRQPALPAWTLTIVASALALYGLWTALQQSTG